MTSAQLRESIVSRERLTSEIFKANLLMQEKKLYRRMQALGVNEQDLEESFVRSSSPGGQNVNKVASCVCLRHRPTGLVVKCQKFRTQAANRFWARQILLEKIERRNAQEYQTKIQQVEKLKRQKRKRSHSAQEKILKSKRIHSEKKTVRRSIRMTDLNNL